MRETKIKTNQIDYDFDGHGGGAESVTLLSITTAPQAPFKAGDRFYSNEETEQFEANVIYKAVVDNSWEYAEALTPELGVFYIFDGETYLYDAKIESLFKIGDSTSSNELYILNQTLPANTTTLTTEVDFSENFLINVYVNGLLQSKDLHYYVSGTNIIFTSTFEEAVNVIILYTSSSDVNINNTPTGTVNYNELINKPKINNIELSGNKSSSDLKLQDKLNEFVVTEEIFNKYKKAYYAGGDVLDIADMISGESISSGDINLNSYSAYFDAYTLANKYYSFANGNIILDNIQEGGCGRAVLLNNAGLVFKHCDISAPKCESGSSIFELNNSRLSFYNSFISADFTERKSFFNIGTNSSLEIDNVSMNLNCKQGLQDSNFGFDFIEVTGDNSNILVKNCQKLRIANDNADTDDGIEYNFIKTAEGKIVIINMFNNVIWMHGRGHEIDKKILNVNLDNIDCHISNNDLQGNLYCRYESKNTVNEKFRESTGGPVTFNVGQKVWDLAIEPQQSDDSAEFSFKDDNFWAFLEAIDVSSEDMSKLYSEYKFTWQEDIGGESGFILNYNTNETYTSNDLISISDLEDNYFIILENQNPQDWHDGDYINIILLPFAQKFLITNQFTIEHNYDFPYQVYELHNADMIQGNIYTFNNNSFDSEAGGYPNFFSSASSSLSGESIHTKHLVLNGRSYEDFPVFEDGVYHPKNGDELNDIFENEPGWSRTIDFSNFDFNTFYENGYTIDGKAFTLRNFSMGSNWGAWQFKWFKSPLFTLTNDATLFCNNFTIDATNIHFNTQETDSSESEPLIKIINGSTLNCQFGMIKVEDVTGIDKLVILQSNDSSISISNYAISMNGYEDNKSEFVTKIGYAIEVNITDDYNDYENDYIPTSVHISSSKVDVNNFDINHVIKYNNDVQIKAEIVNSAFHCNDQSIILPNHSHLIINYSDVDEITAIDQNFTEYEADTTYNVNDILKWVNSEDERHIEYLKVLQQFNSNDYINDIQSGFDDQVFERYYDITVEGNFFAYHDSEQRIKDSNASTTDCGYFLNGLQIKSFFNIENEDYFIPISNENLQANNVKDAINELSNKGSLPDQTGNAGKFLTTNGTNASWAEVQGSSSATITYFDSTNWTLDSTNTILSTGLSLGNNVNVFKNGQLIEPGASNDYTISGNNIVFIEPLTSTDKVAVINGNMNPMQSVGYNTFSNKSILATDWVADNTYSGYSYKCDIPCTGVTSTMYAQVTFAPEEAMSGNYANICDTGTGVVTIYSKVAEAITIPMIMVLGV